MNTTEACLATAILTILFIHGCDRAKTELRLESLEEQVHQLCDHRCDNAPKNCP